MRDIPRLDALLAAAPAEEPTYRFRGRTPPKAGAWAEKGGKLKAMAPPAAVKDGKATLRIYEPIDSWGGDWGLSAAEFAQVVDSLGSDITDIELHLNSPGGEVWEALAILNNLRAHPAKLTAVVDGIAASAASFIAVAADETLMAPNSQLMIHDAAGICLGRAADMHAFGDLLDKVSDNIAAIYSSKSGATLEATRADMLAETWYSDAEAVTAGLADGIQGAEPQAEAPAAAFDLSGIGARYSSRAEAPAPAPAAQRDAAPPEPSTSTADRRQRLQARRHQLNSERARALSLTPTP